VTIESQRETIEHENKHQEENIHRYERYEGSASRYYGS
jgi:hypothetical protein